MSRQTPPSTLPRWAVRALALLLGTCLGLLLLVGVLVWRLGTGTTPFDAELRQEAVREMALSNAGLFDSHPDPDLGRTLTAEMLEFRHHGQSVSTNRFGMREKDYEIPKPPGTLRIVLLGDSMIFGMLAPAEDRLGVQLETQLRERRQPGEGEVEVLHLGVPSWNLRNQATFLRRQLSLLDPDLVLHVLVPNDIEDDYGVRGFGAAAAFSPQKRYRADGRLHSNVPYDLLPEARPSWLRLSLDFESRSRYRDMAGELEGLARLLENQQIPYRILFHYRRLSPIAWDQVGRGIEEELGVQTLYTSIDFGLDPALAAAENDPHWNRRGHELMAQLLYHLIEKDSLLPSLSLPPWGEAQESFERIAGQGRLDATKPGKAERMRSRLGAAIESEIHFDQLDSQGASQVHGGLDGEALLMPFASFILRGGASRLHILGEELGRVELEGARLEVRVDGVVVGEIEIRGEAETIIDRTFDLPTGALAREFLTVQLAASDFVYVGEDFRQCRVLKLRRLAAIP